MSAAKAWLRNRGLMRRYSSQTGRDNFGGHDSWMVLERIVRARHASGGVDFGVSDRASVGGLFCFGKGRVRLSKMQIFKQLFSRFFCGL